MVAPRSPEHKTMPTLSVWKDRTWRACAQGKHISRFYFPLPSPPPPCEACISILSPHLSPWATATVTFKAQLLPHPDRSSITKLGKGVSSRPEDRLSTEDFAGQNTKWGLSPSLGLAFLSRGWSTGVGGGGAQRHRPASLLLLHASSEGGRCTDLCGHAKAI